jgi:hypothetical protein
MKWFNSASINHKYIDTVIAKYDPKGHSGQNIDKNFIKNRSHLIQTYFPEEYSEIYRETTALRQKAQELALIKSSKLWKARNICVKIMQLIWK